MQLKNSSLFILALSLIAITHFVSAKTGNSFFKEIQTGKTEQSSPIEIIVDKSKKLQTMDGIGANSYSFPFANNSGWDWDKVKFVFDEIDVQYIRLAPWFSSWESSNDNDDPNILDLNSEGFDPKNVIKDHDLGYLNFLNDRGIEVMLGIWDAADWMTAKNEKNQTIIPKENYDELGESIAAYLKYMQQNGINIKLTEVQNEPAINAAIRYPYAEHLQRAALQVIDQLNKNGLKDVMLHGPNMHSPENVEEWGSVFFSNPIVKNRNAAVSYHTWWSANYDQYKAIKNFAAKENLPVWATEVGYCALARGCFLEGKQHYLRPETWVTAWDYAMSYYRAIDWSRATRVYHWSLLGHDAIIAQNGEKLPSYYIFKQFANYIPSNAIYLDSHVDDSNVLPMVFLLPDNTFSAIIINKDTGEKQVILKSVNQSKKYLATKIVTSAENNYESEIKPNKLKSGLKLILPPESVTSVKFK